MEHQKIKVRLSSGAQLPEYQSLGASGADVRAHIEEKISIEPGSRELVPTGIFVEIPLGYEIQIRPRSGLALKKGIMVVNSPGTIDSDYRGEIKVIMYNSGKEVFEVEPQMRIAQMVLCPVLMMDFEQVDELSDSKRSSVGFGSTGVS